MVHARHDARLEAAIRAVPEWRGHDIGITPLSASHDDEHFLIEAGTARHWLGRRRLLARAGDGWIVPAGTAHIHPGNVGDEPLVVRQWIQLDTPDPGLLRGVERYFETVSSLAAQGRVDRFGRIKDPLQEAVTLTETLMPGTWFAGIPIPAQRALLERLAALGRRRGRVAEPSPL